MLMKTHLAIAGAAALFLLNHVNNKLVFVPIVLFATLLPDIDSMHSKLGNKWYLRPMQFFTKHRGVIHSFSLCLVLAGFMALYFPVVALPFFLGYGVHLLSDSFTVEGIRPFWPLGAEAKGKIKTGGVFEQGIYYSFLVVCFVLILMLFF